MPIPKQCKPAHASPADSTRAVDAFMAALVHPFKNEIEQVRALILRVDPSIAEGIKWNAPSFRTSEYFATTNLRSKGGVGVILHLGAKSRALPAGGVAISDPDHLLQWLATDRATVTFKDSEELRARATAFQSILRQWITYV